MASKLRKQVRLDPLARLLEVDGRKETRMVSLKEVGELRMYRPMVRGKGGPRPGSPRLSAFLRDGGEIELHDFASSGDGEEVARKVGSFFAEAAGLPFREGGGGA